MTSLTLSRSLNRLLLTVGLWSTGWAGLAGKLPAQTPVPPLPPSPPPSAQPTLPILEKKPPTHQELLKLAPEEREARLKALRDRKVGGPKDALTPAEREKRRLEIRQRLEKRLENLRKKKKEKPLSPEEEKQLQRLEEVSRGWQSPKKAKPAPQDISSQDKR